MPWVLDEEIQEENQAETPSENAMPQGNWVVDESEEKEPSTSPLRAISAPFRGAAIGAGVYGSLQDALSWKFDPKNVQHSEIDPNIHLQGVGEMPTAEKPLPGQKAKWEREHEILTRMQNPSYKPSIYDLAMLENDDVLQEDLKAASSDEIAEMIDTATRGRLIPQTGTERLLTNIGKTGVEFGLLGGRGGKFKKEAMTGGLFGLGEQLAEEAGQEGIGKFVSGLTFASAPALVKAGIKTVSKAANFAKNVKNILSESGVPEGAPKFLEEAGTKPALADLELSQKDIAGRTAQVSDEMVNKFDELSQKGNWEKVSDLKEVVASDIEKDILKRNQEAVLDTVAKKPETHKVGWEGIKNIVEASHDDAVKAYTSLYDNIDTIAKKIYSEPTETFTAAKKLAQETRATLFRAPEEAGIKNASEILVQRLAKPQGKLAETLVADLKKEGIFADYEEVLSLLREDAMKGAPRQIRLDKLLATKRSINRILSKADIIPAPVKLLNSIAKALKKDIYSGLEKMPGAAEMFANAEEAYAQTQELFANDAILKLRKTENPEAMTNLFSTSSNKEKLNNVLIGQKSASNLADRMILENASTKGKEAAQQFTREVSPYLGEEAQKALNALNEYGDKLTSKGQQSLIMGNMLSDIQKAFEEGSRPDYTLKLMQNKNGYNLVKNALSTSPKGRDIFKSLQRQTVSDLMSSIVNDSGKIDFEKAKDLFKNQFVKDIVRDTIGQDGLNFFERLEGYGKNLQKNLSILKKFDPGFLERTFEKYMGKTFAALFTLILPVSHGIGLTGLAAYGIKEGVKAGSQAVRRARLFKILQEPDVIPMLKKISNPNANQKIISEGMKRIAQIANRYEMEPSESE